MTDEFEDWYIHLSVGEQRSVIRVVSLLEEYGVGLAFPFSSQINGSRFAMRELRIQHSGDPYRVLYVFDPKRQAVLLLGGIKTGKGNRWYEQAIRHADHLYERYLRGER